MVFGAAGVAVSAFGVGLFGLFPLVLVSLLVMGTSDGVSIVAENGIMQRRTPDAIRSRTMAAFEAIISLGLAVSYIVAGPVLNAVGPQAVYRIGGVAALAAAFMLLPLRGLRQSTDVRVITHPDAAGATVVGEPVAAAEELAS
jgi:MFS family permease